MTVENVTKRWQGWKVNRGMTGFKNWQRDDRVEKLTKGWQGWKRKTG